MLALIPVAILSYLSYKNVINWKIVVAIALFTYCSPKWIIKLLSRMYPKVMFDNEKTSIHLSFDDVPTSRTLQIINELNKNDMKSTLFVISNYVNDDNRSWLIDAIKSGHVLANHGMTDSAYFLKSSQKLRDEIMMCDKLINELYIESWVDRPMNSYIYRPGGGIFTNNMIKVAEELKYKVVLGNVYPFDAYIPFHWLNYFYLKLKVSLGDIIVLHDRPWTMPLLTRLFPFFKSRFVVKPVII